MYMCTYICGARNASVRALCLHVHFHMETCPAKSSLELASSLVHRPNCCFSFGPQAKQECRFFPGCLKQGVLHHECCSPVWAPQCWLAVEFGMLKRYKTIYFFSLGRLKRTELPGNWGKRHLPQARCWCPLHPQSHTGESPTPPMALHWCTGAAFFWELHCSLLLQQQRTSLGEGLWFAVYKPIKKTQMKYPAGKVKSNEVVCCEKW